ncbi:uromodulin-like isoform X2 [Protopterus annectens]|nr:uromodulin-like isoform X2 [Protopterus annectens]
MSFFIHGAFFSRDTRCRINICRNKGVCHIEDGIPTCYCQHGYTGTTCQGLDAKVYCEESHIDVLVSKGFFVWRNITPASVHLKDPSCSADLQPVIQGHDEQYYRTRLYHLGNRSCGTEILRNGSHIIYTNVLQTGVFGDSVITRLPNVQVNFSCAYIYEHLVHLPLSVGSLVEFVLAEGDFTVKMTIHMQSDFADEVTSTSPLQPSDTVYVVMKLQGKKRIKFFVLSLIACWATPNQNPSHSVKYELISDGCPKDDTVKYLNQMGNDSVAVFNMSMFRFVEFKDVYLHCLVQLCAPVQPGSCIVDCNAFRKKRSVPRKKEYEAILSYGPIMLKTQKMSEHLQKSELPIVMVVTILLFGMDASLLIMFAAKALGKSLCRRQRSKSYCSESPSVIMGQSADCCLSNT